MKTIIFSLLAVVAVLTGCKEKIEIDLDETTSRLVIDAELTTEKKVHSVKLNMSTSYFEEGSMPTVSGALVILNDGSGDLMLNETDPGVYSTPDDFAGIPGKTYMLTVSYDGKKYTATSVMPQVVPMDSIVFEKTTLPIQPGVIIDPAKSYYNICVYCQEPGNTKDFYMVDVIKNGVMLTDTLAKKIIMDDEVVNGSYLDGYRAIQINAVPGDEINFSISTIQREYFLFVYSVIQTQFSGNPFSGPPANADTNFSGGAAGFFITRGVHSLSGVIKPLP
ncbi:MAG: hypothetical protein A2W91_04905 [Bacteroidetes bacterium GWF2_38_335]|nr:MAG: hypothetical protein A2W91_04905 [Bacteroidetes bacterium GWF2_38_335]OFY79830.1 MAG: hypothetical protein A2281_10515 [Bacteroidetes bacterium RIFOXYA12_FULL_38_20]